MSEPHYGSSAGFRLDAHLTCRGKGHDILVVKDEAGYLVVLFAQLRKSGKNFACQNILALDRDQLVTWRAIHYTFDSIG